MAYRNILAHQYYLKNLQKYYFLRGLLDYLRHFYDKSYLLIDCNHIEPPLHGHQLHKVKIRHNSNKYH